MPEPLREYLDSRAAPALRPRQARVQGAARIVRGGKGGRYMNSRDIILWLDEHWYDTLSRQLKKKDTSAPEGSPVQSKLS